MKTRHLLTAAAILTLTGGPALAQTPAAPSARPADAQTTPKAPPQSTPAATGTSAQAPSAPAATASATASAAPVVASGDIIQTAQASGQFKTFLKAAAATNLTNLLKTQKNITVFAPTDAAFAALPAGEMDKLMLPENKPQLQKLLIYHLVNAPVKSADFKGATRTAATVAGPSVELQGGEKLMVNDATIVQADIAASNGVLHVVDKVLSPTTATAAASSTGAAAASTAGAAASATEPASPPAPATQPQPPPKK